MMADQSGQNIRLDTGAGCTTVRRRGASPPGPERSRDPDLRLRAAEHVKPGAGSQDPSVLESLTPGTLIQAQPYTRGQLAAKGVAAKAHPRKGWLASLPGVRQRAIARLTSGATQPLAANAVASTCLTTTAWPGPSGTVADRVTLMFSRTVTCSIRAGSPMFVPRSMRSTIDSEASAIVTDRTSRHATRRSHRA